MIEAYAGKDKFEAKLDEMFNSESKTTGRKLMLWITGHNMHTETKSPHGLLVII
jgi:hypothetical protein